MVNIYDPNSFTSTGKWNPSQNPLASNDLGERPTPNQRGYKEPNYQDIVKNQLSQYTRSNTPYALLYGSNQNLKEQLSSSSSLNNSYYNKVTLPPAPSQAFNSNPQMPFDAPQQLQNFSSNYNVKPSNENQVKRLFYQGKLAKGNQAINSTRQTMEKEFFGSNMSASDFTSANYNAQGPANQDINYNPLERDNSTSPLSVENLNTGSTAEAENENKFQTSIMKGRPKFKRSIANTDKMLDKFRFSNLEESNIKPENASNNNYKNPDSYLIEKSNDILNIISKNVIHISDSVNKLLEYTSKKKIQEEKNKKDKKRDKDDETTLRGGKKNSNIFGMDKAFPSLDRLVKKIHSVGWAPLLLLGGEILAVLKKYQEQFNDIKNSTINKTKNVIKDIIKGIVDIAFGPLIRGISDIASGIGRFLKGDWAGGLKNLAAGAANIATELVPEARVARGAMKVLDVASDAQDVSRDAGVASAKKSNPINDPNYSKRHGGMLKGIWDWITKGSDKTDNSSIEGTNKVIKKFENSDANFKSQIYSEPSGRRAVGYGHDITDQEEKQGYILGNDGSKISIQSLERHGITKDQANSIMDRDIKGKQDQLRKHIGAETWDKLPSQWKIALTDRAYNAGIGSVTNNKKFVKALQDNDLSSALKFLNDGSYTTAKGKNGQHIKLDALVKRRQFEHDLAASNMRNLGSVESHIDTSVNKKALDLSPNAKMKNFNPTQSTKTVIHNNTPVTIHNGGQSSSGQLSSSGYNQVAVSSTTVRYLELL